MDIAVCDDSMEALNDVRNVLIETNRVNLIECFNDIDRFMRDVEDGSRYDIVMMDIDWKEKKNGIDYAAWLYDKAPDTRLIFFTGYSQEYIEDVFMQRTNIEGYLKKPVKKDRVIKIIDKIENSKRNMNLQKLVIKQRGQIQTVAYKSIIYIEGSNHLVKNSADKNQKKKIRSSEHGWGMKILDDIAQQYNGRLEYGFKDGIYSTMVSLVYTNNQEEDI